MVMPRIVQTRWHIDNETQHLRTVVRTAFPDQTIAPEPIHEVLTDVCTCIGITPESDRACLQKRLSEWMYVRRLKGHILLHPFRARQMSRKQIDWRQVGWKGTELRKL